MAEDSSAFLKLLYTHAIFHTSAGDDSISHLFPFPQASLFLPSKLLPATAYKHSRSRLCHWTPPALGGHKQSFVVFSLQHKPSYTNEQSPHLARICSHHSQRLRLLPTDLVLCRWIGTFFFWIMASGFHIRKIHMDPTASTLPSPRVAVGPAHCMQTESPPSKQISDIRIIQADVIPNWGHGNRKRCKRQLIFLCGKIQIYNLPFLVPIACTHAYL